MTCNETFTGPESYAKHGDFSIDGKGCFSGAHSSPAIKNFVRCNACNTGISGVKNMKEHDQGRKHRNALTVLQGKHRSALAELQGSSPVPLKVPTGKLSLPTFTVYDDMSSSPLTLRASSGQPVGDDTSSFCTPQPMTIQDSSTCSSNPHNVSPSSISDAPRGQDRSTNREGKHGEAVNTMEDRDQEQSSSFSSSASGCSAAHIAVKPVYSDDGMKCKVGGLEGYSCKKCGIVLFLNLEAAERHYKTESHSAYC